MVVAMAMPMLMLMSMVMFILMLMAMAMTMALANGHAMPMRMPMLMVVAMLMAGAVQIAATADVQAHMGAALRPAKEDQICRTHKLLLIGSDGHGLAEPFLLIGVTGNPDAGAGKCPLHQSRAVVIGAQAAPP